MVAGVGGSAGGDQGPRLHRQVLISPDLGGLVPPAVCLPTRTHVVARVTATDDVGAEAWS